MATRVVRPASQPLRIPRGKCLLPASDPQTVAVSLKALSFCEAVKQIKLTAKQIEGFIASQKDMKTITEKMQGSSSDRPDPKIQAELEGVARKHGFKDFAEYDDVAANISMLMAGFDPQTKAFVEPQVAINKEIDEVRAGNSIPNEEKKKMLEELNQALKVAQPIQHTSNIEIVKKYYDKIEAVLQ